jgi:hypothetical protein
MGGCPVHECGPFEAGQVHEERQGPDNRGTEGACPAPPICVGTHACRESHLNGEITSGESCIPSGFTASEGLDLDLGPWHSTRYFDAALGAQQHGAPTWPEAGKARTPSMFSHCVIDCFMTTWIWCVMLATLSRCAAAHPVGEQPQRGHWSGQWVVRSVGREQVSGSRTGQWVANAAMARRLHKMPGTRSGQWVASAAVAQRLHATPSWAPSRDVLLSMQSVGVERRRQLGDEWQRPLREHPAGARYRSYNAGRPSRLSTWHIWSTGGAGSSGLADQLRRCAARSRLHEAEAGKGAHKQSRRHWTSASGALRESICERAASSRRRGGYAPAPRSRSPRAEDAPWSRSPRAEDAPPPVALSPILLLLATHQPGYVLTSAWLRTDEWHSGQRTARSN